MERRGPYIRTLKTDRLRMVWMWLAGKSARTISLETGISICTVYRWIRRWREEGSVDSRPYRGKYRTPPLFLAPYSSTLRKHHSDSYFTLDPVCSYLTSSPWQHRIWGNYVYAGYDDKN